MDRPGRTRLTRTRPAGAPSRAVRAALRARMGNAGAAEGPLFRRVAPARPLLPPFLPPFRGGPAPSEASPPPARGAAAPQRGRRPPSPGSRAW